MYIELKGLDDVQKQMKRIERGTKAMGRKKYEVGTRLPYAYGIEFGRHRKTGKLARQKGGALYVTRAIETVLSGADRDMSEGLNKVTSPGAWVLIRLARWARRLARKNAPRGPKNKGHSYRLRTSIKYREVK